MRARNWAYDRHYKSVQRVDVPVISVGNLTLGGTGKTPLVAWIARWLRERDVRVALVSRGYGATADALNDEALELARPTARRAALAERRSRGSREVAIEEFDCQVIVLDDGFQHRRLARDLDIVLLDACEPFGFEHVFPRGTLREPICGAPRLLCFFEGLFPWRSPSDLEFRQALLEILQRRVRDLGTANFQHLQIL